MSFKSKIDYGTIKLILSEPKGAKEVYEDLKEFLRSKGLNLKKRVGEEVKKRVLSLIVMILHYSK